MKRPAIPGVRRAAVGRLASSQWIFHCSLLIALSSPVFAAFTKEDRGTATAQFLKLGVGARAMGLAEAYSAEASDATALYWNPAGLARAPRHSATLMHAPYLESTYYDFAAYAHRSERTAWGLGVQYFSAGSLMETDENNASLGSFTPNDLAVSAGYAYRLTEDGWAVGGAIKYVQSKILATAKTVAFDAGVQSRLFFDRLRLGFAMANLGGKMKFEEASESLPIVLRFGSALQLGPRWLATADLIAPKDNAPYVAVGSEYQWLLSNTFALAGRLGYNSRTAGDIDGVTGLAVGFGGRWDLVGVDYAFLPFGSLGVTHRISLTLRWGGAADDQVRTIKPAAPSSAYSDELP